jgi:hypothetical protein
MIDPHKYPVYIFTNQLHISHIFISHESAQVTLLGCYGDLLEGKMATICFETDFASLNDLLAEPSAAADDVINRISNCLVNPSDDVSVIDLCDEGGVFFSEHLFALQLMDEDEDRMIKEEEWTYHLVSCITRQGIFPGFDDFVMPQKGRERLEYLNSLLTIQYVFYLTYKQKMEHPEAAIYSNLVDPLYFQLAKTMYELQTTGKTKHDPFN